MIGIPANNKITPEEVWQDNFKIIQNSMNADYGKIIINDIFEYYIEEIGIEKLINYLQAQDKIEQINDYNFINYQSIFFEQRSFEYKIDKRNKLYDEEDNNLINNQKNIEYNYELIKANLFRYFIQEMVEEIPENSILRDEKDVNDFIKMYEVKFLYEYVIPISELNDDEKRKIN